MCKVKSTSHWWLCSKVGYFSAHLKKSELIQGAKQTEIDHEGVKHFCKLASKNLDNFTFSEKRLALDALRIEVWVEAENISITGVVPTFDTASTQLKPGRQGWLFLCYGKNPYKA